MRFGISLKNANCKHSSISRWNFDLIIEMLVELTRFQWFFVHCGCKVTYKNIKKRVKPFLMLQ